jgi:glycosyltransferase 2 family protein
MSVATATAATILVRLCTLWFGVALGGIALALLRATQSKHGASSEPKRTPQGTSP